MPIKTETVPPELFLEHNGVKIYKTYRDDLFEHPVKLTFTKDPNVTNSRLIHPAIFNVPSVRHHEPSLLDVKAAEQRGITMADFVLTPEYVQSRVAWDHWWAVDETRHIQEAIIKMIVEGSI